MNPESGLDRLHDVPRPLFSADDIASTCKRLAMAISADHPDGVLLISVLKGSIPFLSDLSRFVTVPCEFEFLAITKFAADSGRVQVVKDLDSDIGDRNVVLVEDVADTGLSLTYVLNHLRAQGPASLRVCALIDKVERRIVPVPLAYIGYAVGEEFLIGYGLDYKERYRNLSSLYAVDHQRLQADPDAYVGLR